MIIGDRAVYIAPNGQQYSFAAPTFLLQEDGIGSPPVEYITQRGPFQHGETVKDFFLRPRTIQIIIRRQGISRADYLNLAAQLLNIMSPMTVNGVIQPGIYRKYLSNGKVREFLVYVSQGPAFPSNSPDVWDEWSIRDTIRFTAYDPVARDPNIKSFQATVPVTIGGFPITFPLEMAQFGIANSNVNYGGNWLTYPSIYITGPVSSPVITNVTTGEKIEFSYALPAGFTILIDLAFGQKTVFRNDGANLIGFVTTDSDLGTFHLQPGINQIQVLGTGTSPGATSVLIQWYDRYLGGL